MNDTAVIIIIAIILICHLATIIIGLKIKKTILSISYLNAIFAIVILVFFVIETLNIKQHQFQFRELFIICLEVCTLIFALYSIKGFYNKTYVKIINHISFWLHILATIGMLIFMSAFKLNKLY